MVAQLQKYLSLDGVEVANGWRTDSYVRQGLVRGFELDWCFNSDLLNAVPHPGAVANPVTDPAPWYDAADADSTHFFGVAIRHLSMEVPLERANQTSRRIGRLRTTLRRFTMEVDILADDCCGTDYGRRWLLSRFDAGCGSGCATSAAQLVVCGRDGEETDRLRDVYSVGLESVEDITPNGMNCCWGAVLKLTFLAENPWLYGPSFAALAATVWDLVTPVENVDCAPWDDCPEPTLTACDTAVTGTLAPPPLPSLAGPLAPGGTNVPWCAPTFEANQCVFVASPAAYGEAVIRVTLTAGPTDMLNARIRVYPNDDEGDCESNSTGDANGLISELRIGRIPANGILVVDGSTQTISLYCPETVNGVVVGWINADHLLFGPNSALWQHPVVGCGQGSICVCATVDAENTDTDATFEVEIIQRYL